MLSTIKVQATELASIKITGAVADPAPAVVPRSQTASVTIIQNPPDPSAITGTGMLAGPAEAWAPTFPVISTTSWQNPPEPSFRIPLKKKGVACDSIELPVLSPQAFVEDTT